MKKMFYLFILFACRDCPEGGIIYKKFDTGAGNTVTSIVSKDSCLRGYRTEFYGNKSRSLYFDGYTLYHALSLEGNIIKMVEGNGFVYDKAGRPRMCKNGLEIDYYQYGRPKEIMFNHEGEMDGVRLLFDTSGHIIERQVWKKGKRISRGKYLQYKEIE